MRPATTMAELLLVSCKRHAQLPALSDARRIMTYSQLLDWSARLAGILRSHGLGRHDRIAIVADDCVEGVAAYFGGWLAGCTAVHVNARLAGPEVQHLIEDSQAKGVLYTTGLPGMSEVLAGMDGFVLVSSLDDSSGTEFARQLDGASPSVPVSDAAADDIAIIGYTSGTSGRPKGAMVSHRSAVLCSRVLPHSLQMPKRSRMAYTGSLSFVGTIWGHVLPHLYIGGMVRILGRYDLDSWFAAMREDRSTYTYLPTPLMADFAERLAASPEILDHLQVVLHAGSLAPSAHVSAVVEACAGRYVETYGSTEIVGSVTATSPGMYRGPCAADDLLASAGMALPSAQVWIETPDGGVAGPGAEGPIIVRSDTLFDGYWNDPAKTAGVLRPDGAFDTGDLGAIDDAGFLYVKGRHSDLIISGGLNIYPAEVERAILTNPGVREVAVFGAPHPHWGEGVVAAVVRRPGAVLEEPDLIETCRAQLAGYKKPTAVVFLDELPQNASRKVDRGELRARFKPRNADTVTPSRMSPDSP